MTRACDGKYTEVIATREFQVSFETLRCQLPAGHYIDHVSRNSLGEVVEWKR